LIYKPRLNGRSNYAPRRTHSPPDRSVTKTNSQTRWGAYSAATDPLLDLGGREDKDRREENGEGKGGEGWKGRGKGKGKEEKGDRSKRKGKERKGKGTTSSADADKPA